MTVPRIRLCTLAVGADYRAMARRLVLDLQRSVPGARVCHESLRRHLERWWPSWVREFADTANAVGVDFSNAVWISEALYVLAKDGGRELDFIEHWGELAIRLGGAGFRGGTGNIMGLAAAQAGLSVQWGRWIDLKKKVKHLNASQVSALARHRGACYT